jgi:uncharacterized protein
MNHERTRALPADSEDVAGPTDDEVVDFLSRHPDFLSRHPDVLSRLVPPSRWSDDVVVDLQKAMVETLKEELAGLRTCTQDVIETSRSNMANQTRTHAAVLALIAAESLERLVRIVAEDLPLVLDVDVAVLALEPGLPPTGFDAEAGCEIRALEQGDVDDLLGDHQDVLLLAHVVDGGAIFDGGAGLVRSAAFVRLAPSVDVPTGVLALGCRHEQTFQAKQGTELLRFLAKVIESCLHRLTVAPA